MQHVIVFLVGLGLTLRWLELTGTTSRLSFNCVCKVMNHNSEPAENSWTRDKKLKSGRAGSSWSCSVNGRYSCSLGTSCEGEEGYNFIQNTTTNASWSKSLGLIKTARVDSSDLRMIPSEFGVDGEFDNNLPIGRITEWFDKMNITLMSWGWINSVMTCVCAGGCCYF